MCGISKITLLYLLPLDLSPCLGLYIIMATYRAVSHVIFDLDGLLINTETLYTRATQKVLDEYGKKLTWEIKVKVMGKTSLEAAQMIIDELELPLTPVELNDKLAVHYEAIFPSAELLPGAERLVRHLHSNNVPIAIATGSGDKNFKLKTDHLKEFIALFHHVVLSSSDPEVKRGKPAPDAFLICASRFPDKPSNEKILVFEDAPNGVEAAVTAGMQVVMVPDPQLDEQHRKKNATLILDSLEQFRPEEFGLPNW